MRKIWYCPEYPPSAPSVAAAQAAGATEIVQSATQAGYVQIAQPGDTLADQIAQALSALQARREAARATFSYTVNGTPYQLPCDVAAGSNVLGAIVGLQVSGAQQNLGGPAPDAITWKLGPGVTAQLKYNDLVALGQAMRAHVQACYNLEAQYATQIAASQTPLAVDVSQGWPA